MKSRMLNDFGGTPSHHNYVNALLGSIDKMRDSMEIIATAKQVEFYHIILPFIPLCVHDLLSLWSGSFLQTWINFNSSMSK